MNSGTCWRATYASEPTDRLVRTKFGIWPQTIERWKTEGLPDGNEEQNLLSFYPSGIVGIGTDLGNAAATSRSATIAAHPT